MKYTSEQIMAMSPKQLQVAIAEAKGIEYRISNGSWDFICGDRMYREYAEFGDMIGKFFKEEYGEYDDLMPYWSNSIVDALVLVDELNQDDYKVTMSIFKDRHEVYLEWIDPSEDGISIAMIESIGETLPLAISRAWLLAAEIAGVE